MSDETTKLVIGIYDVFQEQEVTMLEAFMATLSIATSIAKSHNMSKENFLKECEDCFGDGERFDHSRMMN